MNEFRLTTIDNPYNPFTQFEEWAIFDSDKGYNTCSYLARVANLSDSMSDVDKVLETNRAIDEIIKLNPLGIYTKVAKV